MIREHAWDPGFELSWCTTYELLECCGCEAVSVRSTYSFSEGDGEEVTYFPPRVSRRAPLWVRTLSKEMQALLEEIYTALHANSRRLALMGARTVVDLVIQEKVGDAGTFKQKLDALLKAGDVSARQKRVLEAALEAGNAAAHRGHEPSSEELNQVMDIVESLLQADLLDAAAKTLVERTPKRPKKKDASPE